MANSAKEIRNLADLAESQGWDVVRTKKNHWKWTSPDGVVIFSGGTPSDHRAWMNHIARLRRAGLEV